MVGSAHSGAASVTPLEMIAEWRKGCSCAPKGQPEECRACTRGLINALEKALLPPTWVGIDAAGTVPGSQITIIRLDVECINAETIRQLIDRL
jgi:hypothetical protein